MPIEIGHYRGEAGIRYFEYQSRFGAIAGEITARKFANYIKPSDVVLDFGCGGGFTLKNLTAAKCLGVEVNPVAREAAERNGITCFATLDDIDDETVDVVISNHTLEHVPSPLETLRGLALKLKPGGLLLVIVPIDDWREQRFYSPDNIDHHLYTWTPLLLGNLFYEAGFDPHTYSTTIGVNGWFRGFPRYYKRVPVPLLNALLRVWSTLRKRRELCGIVRKLQSSSCRP